MIILYKLRQRDRTWQHFFFGEGFENLPQPGSEKKKKGKKQPTPHSNSRKWRALSPIPPGETSSKKNPDDRKLTKKLKRKIKKQEVLERVIKERYEIMSKNFTKTDETLKKLALKRVKENKQKKKIVKDNNKLWRISR
jgi:hypothetical protein